MKTSTTYLDAIGKSLVKKCQTLGVAESVTSGNLQAAFSLAKKATEFFQGGITLYNTGQKARHLHIDPIAAERTNCVSEQIANDMAVGACGLFSSDWAIAVTGYAAPVPEWNIRSVMFAWYAFAFRGNVVLTRKIEVRKMSMDRIQQLYVRTILKSFAEQLQKV